MSYTVKPNGDIVCDTPEEAVALARIRCEAKAAPVAVGEPISTTRWHEIHAHDKRMAAQVESLKALAPFFDCLTPLQRQACEMRITGKWPAEIAQELGRTTGTIQAIIWDAKKRMLRRERGEPLPTQAEISSMGGRAAAAKRRGTSCSSPSTEEAKQQEAAAPVEPAAPAAKQRSCRKCGKPGHYAKTCKEEDAVAPPAPATATPRAAVDVNTRRRNEYAAKFFPYIEKVARQLARRLPAHIEINDLISSGVIGLMEAAERFDPELIDRFEAFAAFRIRGAMLDDLRSRDTLSRDMRRVYNEVREATRQLEAQLGRAPDPEELAKHLGIGIDELYARQKKLSGSTVVGIDDLGPDLLEHTADQSAADPFEIAARRETMQRVAAGIGELPAKMQQAMLLYYSKGLSLKEVGEAMGLTESRVCQILADATGRLRDNMKDLAA